MSKPTSPGDGSTMALFHVEALTEAIPAWSPGLGALCIHSLRLHGWLLSFLDRFQPKANSKIAGIAIIHSLEKISFHLEATQDKIGSLLYFFTKLMWPILARFFFYKSKGTVTRAHYIVAFNVPLLAKQSVLQHTLSSGDVPMPRKK